VSRTGYLRLAVVYVAALLLEGQYASVLVLVTAVYSLGE